LATCSVLLLALFYIVALSEIDEIRWCNAEQHN
jgi:hypothetical protein